MRFLFVGVTLFLCPAFFAQSNPEQRTTELIQLLEKSWNNPSVFQFTTTTTNSLLPYLVKIGAEDDSRIYNYDEYYESYIDLTRKQIGLDFRGDVVQNLDPTFNDIEDNILYRRRYQVGLEWDILKNGYVDSRQKVKTLEAEKELNNYHQRSQNTGINSIQRNACIAFFNVQKTHLLNDRERQLKEILPILEELFYLKKISLEVLYSFQSRIVETKAQQNIYTSYNAHIFQFVDSSIRLLNAPVFDLSDSFYTSIDKKLESDTVIQRLKTALIGNLNWYNDIQLKAYSRYNMYDLVQGANRSFFSIGLTTTVPFPFTYKEQRRFNAIKQEKQFHDIIYSFNANQLELLNESYEYRYIVKQYAQFLQKLKLLNETIRIESAKQELKDPDFNPLNGLKLLDERLQIGIELIDLQQKMYLKLLEINEKTLNSSIEQQITPFDIDTYSADQKLVKNVYAWTSTFEKGDAEILSSYSVYNEFNTVFLAVKEEDSVKNVKDAFVVRAYESGLKIVPLIGQNKLLSSTQFSKDLATLLQQSKNWKSSEIHLDLEPHTLDAWQTNRAELTTTYLRCIKEARAYCDSNQLKLSISIPLHYDTLLVKELLESVDQIHFMCYENINPEYITRKLKPYANQLNQLTIAVRTEDFTSRNDLEVFIKQLAEMTLIPRFSYHDLNRLMQMDKTLLDYEKH